MIIEKMSSKIAFWLESFVEDENIPFEVDKLFFVIFEDVKGFHIGFGGREFCNNKRINFFDYFPLEAQFFYFLNDENLKDFLIFFKECLKFVLEKENIKKIFEKKTAFLAVFDKNYCVRI